MFELGEKVGRKAVHLRLIRLVGCFSRQTRTATTERADRGEQTCTANGPRISAVVARLCAHVAAKVLRYFPWNPHPEFPDQDC
jgi:hypothetical protein